MDEKLNLPLDLINEIAHGLWCAGWTLDEVRELGDANTAAKVRASLPSYIAATQLEFLVDLDADPPPSRVKGLKLRSNVKGGKFTFNPKKLKLYSSKRQNRSWVVGSELLEELEWPGRPAGISGNAAFMNWILAPENQCHIPAEMRGINLYFFGTVYEDSIKRLFVYYAFWDGHRWDKKRRNLGEPFFSNCQAVLLEANQAEQYQS
jgi:hypothetical protein